MFPTQPSGGKWFVQKQTLKKKKYQTNYPVISYLIDTISNSMDMNLSKLWEIVKDREAWRAIVHGVAVSDMTEWMNNKNRGFMFERNCQPWRKRSPRLQEFHLDNIFETFFFKIFSKIWISMNCTTFKRLFTALH